MLNALISIEIELKIDANSDSDMERALAVCGEVGGTLLPYRRRAYVDTYFDVGHRGDWLLARGKRSLRCRQRRKGGVVYFYKRLLESSDKLIARREAVVRAPRALDFANPFVNLQPPLQDLRRYLTGCGSTPGALRPSVLFRVDRTQHRLFDAHHAVEFAVEVCVDRVAPYHWQRCRWEAGRPFMELEMELTRAYPAGLELLTVWSERFAKAGCLIDVRSKYARAIADRE